MRNLRGSASPASRSSVEQQVQPGQGFGPALRGHVIAHVLHQGRRCLGVVDLEGELCTFRLVFILLLAQGSRG